MNKFLKSVRSTTSNKDEVIKKSVIDQLKHSVKEIQYCAVEDHKNNGMVDITEAATALCSTIEAMFLHGLRDSLTYRFKRALADVDERPEPNFWSPLLVISHKQIIDQVMNLSQITSEVGHCRAWIRLVLNDCLLSSYLMTLRQDSSSLKSFYRPSAFVRDSELLEVAQKLIEGIETFKVFTLPSNSSLLNKWTLPTLMLAGIWVPALKASPQVAHCDDVAQCLDESVRSQLAAEASSDNVSLCSVMSIHSQASSLRQVVALSEDEILKIILANPANESVSSQHTDDEQQKSSSEQKYGQETSHSDSKNDCKEVKSYSIGNQLNNRSGWSFDENQSPEQETAVKDNEEHTAVSVVVEAEKPSSNIGKSDSKVNDSSFNAVIESYNMLSGGFIKTPDLKEVWQKFHSESNHSLDSPADNDNNNKAEDVINSLDDGATKSIPLNSYIGVICNEKGLDRQNFECLGCRHPFNLTTRPRVCAFTGEYFCDTCMSPEKLLIPARIIHNWDFRQYDVSQKAFNYIETIKNDPLVDFKVMNPLIYSVVDAMAVLQSLRNQLNFLRAYLYTCRTPVIEELQKQMATREYMYEHIHQYSIADIYEMENNELPQQLGKVIEFGKEHVMKCWLCSQKGFVCELCEKPKPLFPFDVENVNRCDVCNAVYHKECFTMKKPCPKCERKKRREETPAPSVSVS